MINFSQFRIGLYLWNFERLKDLRLQNAHHMLHEKIDLKNKFNIDVAYGKHMMVSVPHDGIIYSIGSGFLQMCHALWKVNLM